MASTRLACALLLLSAVGSAQPALNLTAVDPNPPSFNTAPNGSLLAGGTGLSNMLLTERFDFSLSWVNCTATNPLDVILVFGRRSPTPFPLPGTTGEQFYVDPDPNHRVIIIDSAGVLGNGAYGESLNPGNSFTIAFPNISFPAGAAIPPEQIVLQAIVADCAGGPFIVTNPVGITFVDPDSSGFAPTISQIVPASGPAGSLVTIQGTNFLRQSDSATFPPSIEFGGQPATNITVVDSQTITCNVPALAAFPTPPLCGPLTVRLRNNPLIAPSAAYVVAPSTFDYQTGVTPTLTSASPDPAEPFGGQVCILAGSGFVDGMTATIRDPLSTYLVTGIPVTLTSPSAGTFVLPPFCSGATAQLKVRNCDGVESAEIPLGFVPLVITNVLGPLGVGPPATGPQGGQDIRLEGTGFTPDLVITFTNSANPAVVQTIIPAVTSVTATTIDLTLPLGGNFCNGPTDITIRSNCVNGSSPSSPPFVFTFTPLSLATANPVQPATGSPVVPPGTTRTLNGAGFLPGLSIDFRSDLFSTAATAAATVLSVSTDGTTATFVPPYFCSGPVSLIVRNPCGAPIPSSPGVYTIDDPVITAVYTEIPVSTRGGSVAILTGTGFMQSADIDIVVESVGCSSVGATVRAPDVVVNSTGTSATVTLPPLFPGAANLRVRNRCAPAPSAAGNLSNAMPFSYDPLVVTTVSPSTETPIPGPGQHSVAGSGFVPGMELVFTSILNPGVTTVVVTTSVTKDGRTAYFNPPYFCSGAASVRARVACSTTPGGFIESPTAAVLTYADPSISGVTIPATGLSPQGGGTVRLDGIGFRQSPDVEVVIRSLQFPGCTAQVSGIVNADGTSLTFTAPALCSGPAKVRVRNRCGTSPGTDSAEADLAYDSLTATSTSAASDSPEGGYLVTVNGSGFLNVPAVSVTFTSLTCPGFSAPATVQSVDSSGTQLVCVAPRLVSGPSEIRVSNDCCGNTTTSAPTLFQFAPLTLATTATVQPASGPPLAGLTRTLNGTGFVTGMTLEFRSDSVPGYPPALATNIVVAANGRSATFLPPYFCSGPSHVVVTIPCGTPSPALTATSQAGAYVFDGPSIASATLGPNASPQGGGTGNITGANFMAASDIDVVLQSVECPTVNALVRAPAVTVNPTGTAITFQIPALFPGNANLFVRNRCEAAPSTVGSTSNTVVVVYESLVAGAINPGTAPPVPGPSSYTIGGTGFMPGLRLVFRSTLDTNISAEVPATSVATDGRSATFVPPQFCSGGTTVRVKVPCANAPSGFLESTNTTTFTFDGPVIGTVVPLAPNVSPQGGASIQVNGTGFQATNVFVQVRSVQFPSCALEVPATVNSTGTSLTFTAPRLCSGAAKIRVRNACGSSPGTISAEADFFYDSLAISSISTNQQDNPRGGFPVTITGSGFLDQLTPTSIRVTVSSLTCPGLAREAQIVSVNPAGTQLVFTAPYLAPGPAEIRVTNECCGNPTTSPPGFLAYAPLNLVALSGPAAPNGISGVNGGGTVTLTGTGFLASPDVAVRLTSFAPGSTVTYEVPATVAGNGHTSLTYTCPPFPAGPTRVDVIVRPRDGAAPGQGTVACTLTTAGGGPNFTYAPFAPPSFQPIAGSASSIGPTTNVFTMPPQFSAPSASYGVISESGTTITVAGQNLLHQTAALLTLCGPPVVAGITCLPSGATLASNPGANLFTTRFFIGQAEQPAIVPTSPTQLAGTTNTFDDAQLWRPNLGFQTMQLRNPPAVSSTNTVTTSAACQPSNSPICTILVQDASPPAISSLSPSFVTNAVSTTGNPPTNPTEVAPRTVMITGTNFFTTNNGSSGTFGTSGTRVTTIAATTMGIPAVWFEDAAAPGTGLWSPFVTLVNSTTLVAEIPPPPAGTNLAARKTMNVYVYNPDLRRNSAAATFTYVPRLTNPQAHIAVSSQNSTLDGQTLLRIAQYGSLDGPVCPPTGTLPPTPSIVFTTNPSPQRDAATDPYASALGLGTGAHDYVFLFNTLAPTPNLTSPGRFFDFDRIDLPPTLTLTAGTVITPLLVGFDAWAAPLITCPPATPLATSRQIRVIVKAVGFTFVNGRFQLVPTSTPTPTGPLLNPPLFLNSHTDTRIRAFVNLRGDSFLPDDAQVNANPLRFRVDQTIPPAGAGRGGRGGANFLTQGLASPPGSPPSPVTGAALTGMSGEWPAPLAVIPTPTSGGGGGGGAVGSNANAGAGGGAGHATSGASGALGSGSGATGSLAGALLGNGCLGLPASVTQIPFGADNALIYGTAGADFTRFASAGSLGTASQLLYGGSGGGGGGGTVVTLQYATIGGRGGNGGGALVAVCDGTFVLDEAGCIRTEGEPGSLGLRSFPSPLVDPVSNPFGNRPGVGGSGAGGTVLVLALGAARITPSTASTARILGTDGAAGFVSGLTTTTEPGGSGAAGRVRIAVGELNYPPTAAGALLNPALQTLISDWQNAFARITSPQSASTGCLPGSPITSLTPGSAFSLLTFPVP